MTPFINRRKFLATAAVAGLALSAGAADSEARLRVAVIGHTKRGNFGHGLDAMWLQIPETEIVAVADADATGLEGALKRLKISTGFADYRKMLAELKPDIVAVAPRFVDEHRDMLIAAIECGARGIYVEKPFCRTPAEADEVLAACEKRKVKIAVAHRNRYHPVLPVLQKLIAEDGIGRMLEIRARGKEDQRGGSLDLWVLGSHLLGLATVFTGRALACSAAVFQDGRLVTKADVKDGDEGVGPLAGNEVHARFETERGIPLFFDSVKGAGNAAAGFGIQIVGAKGIIDLRADTEPLAHLFTGSPFQPVKDARSWVPVTSAGIGKPESVEGIAKMMAAHLLPARDLIAAMREERVPLCSARDGAAIVEMICSVFESHRLGGQRVALPMKTRGNPFAIL